MSIEVEVLRALLTLARRRNSASPSLDQLVAAIGRDADQTSVRRALFSLAQSGLVQRTPAGLRLTFPGLAIAAAAGARPRPLQKSAPAALVTRIGAPRVRRHRAA